MWYNEMFEELEKLGYEQQAEKMSAYMQNRFPFLGVPKPDLKAFMKPYLKPMKKREIDWDFVYACWDKSYREAQYIIKNNFGSKEFFINKAIGWSLRDYSKVNPEWVRHFIEENREQLAPLSIKEGSKLL